MTFGEFQKYLSDKASEFSDMAEKMTTDILRDIYTTASLSYQDAYFRSLVIDFNENERVPKGVVGKYQEDKNNEGQ